jgi:Flp pilus assembly protein TadD
MGSRGKNRGKPDKARQNRRRNISAVVAAGLLLAGFIAAGVTLAVKRGQVSSQPTVSQPPTRYVPRPVGTVTFSKDITPIVFNHCATCHRPDQSAPFPLLTYADVKKRARQIVDVTERRFMPPWLPEPGMVEYADARVLNVVELGLLRQWVDEGAIEGSPADLPALPQWSEGWQLGKPDLIIRMPEPFTLPPEGKDVYRNFTIPIPLAGSRTVAAVEFRPGNPKVVHHAAMKIDRTRFSRELDAREPGPGFAGMNLPETTEAPSGHFLNWQPGKLPYRAPDGLGWRLEPDTDFVVQLHLHPSGKAEPVQSEVGFFFTERAPTNSTFKIILDWPAIDIPSGETNYVIEDRYVLPVDVSAFAVFPHAHYLARDMQAFATLPDGTRRWLLRIADWDFNWQGDYRFAQPIFLPKGTALQMRFTYDNSTNNARNPHQAPQRVRFGTQTTDEMGELWLQVLPAGERELARLSQDYNLKQAEKAMAVNQQRLRSDPDDPKAHLQLGRALLSLGKGGEAQPYFQTAVVRQPDSDEPHYFLGLTLRMQRQLAAARQEFEIALRLNPNSYKAHGNLGMICIEQGDFTQAEEHFLAALRLNPDDPIAQNGLAALSRATGAPKR